MGLEDYEASSKTRQVPKTAFMPISSSTNKRTTVASYLGQYPAAHSVSFFAPQQDSVPIAAVVASLFSSFAFDWAVRQRLVGLNMSEFVMVEAPLPHRNPHLIRKLLVLFADLGFGHPSLAVERLRVPSRSPIAPAALTPRRRIERIAMTNAIAALAMGFGESELRHALADCDMPKGSVESANPKGFWRVDSGSDPELRRTVLTLVAYLDLSERIESTNGDRETGIQSFMTQHQGEGWLLPETLRLADHGLGHDDRARHHQPVASRLGPRFYDWQLAQSADESLREWQLHARNLLGGEEYRASIGRVPRGLSWPSDDGSVLKAAEPEPQYAPEDSATPPQRELLRRSQTDLFQ